MKLFLSAKNSVFYEFTFCSVVWVNNFYKPYFDFKRCYFFITFDKSIAKIYDSFIIFEDTPFITLDMSKNQKLEKMYLKDNFYYCPNEKTMDIIFSLYLIK